MIRKVGIIGGGRMGETLAQLNSLVGLETIVKVKPDATAIRRAHDAIVATHRRDVRRGRETETQAEAALARVRVTGDYGDLAECEVVIEAVHEDVATKQQVLAEVEAVVQPDGVLTSSTSSIPASILGVTLKRPGRLIVTHYIWPAHRRTLVEVAYPAQVETDAVARVTTLLDQQGKTPFVVRDGRGFIITRGLLAYLSEAVYLVRDGLAPDQVDGALEAFGWPMGPCRLMDTIGLRNAAGLYEFLRPVMQARIEGLGLITPGVEAGFRGYLTGKGFYLHQSKGWVVNSEMVALLRSPEAPVQTLAPDGIIDRAVGMMVNEMAHCLAEGVVHDWATAAYAMEGAFDFPAKQGGLLGYMREVGWDALWARFQQFAQMYGPRFRAPELTALPA